MDPFEFRIERYADSPEIGQRLERMRALDAAGVLPLSVAAEAARAERKELIRQFLEAVDGLSMAAAMEVSGVERSAIQRLRAGTPMTSRAGRWTGFGSTCSGRAPEQAREGGGLIGTVSGTDAQNDKAPAG